MWDKQPKISSSVSTSKEEYSWELMSKVGLNVQRTNNLMGLIINNARLYSWESMIIIPASTTVPHTTY